MRDIDWWCLMEKCLYVNERYICLIEPLYDEQILKHVCMLMRDIDWWCLIEPCLYVNESYRDEVL